MQGPPGELAWDPEQSCSCTGSERGKVCLSAEGVLCKVAPRGPPKNTESRLSLVHSGVPWITVAG